MISNKTLLEARRQFFSQGIVSGLIPFMLLSCYFGRNSWEDPDIVLAGGLASVAMMLFANSRLSSMPGISKCIFLTGLACNLLPLLPVLPESPFLVLLYGVIVLSGIFYLTTRKTLNVPVNHFYCFYGAGAVLLTAVILSPVFIRNWMMDSAFSLSAAVVMFLYLRWMIAAKRLLRGILAAVLFIVALSVAWYFSLARIALFCFAVFIIFSGVIRRRPPDMHWLAGITMHPARFLGLTFILLPFLGTLLLRTEFSMKSSISIIDAAFTAVSGVCVTGLNVLNIPQDLTIAGQAVLLLLIQLGGFGIVSIATLILHAMGRFSLNEERLASDLSPRDGAELMLSLKQVLVVSLWVEFVGVVLLWGGFMLDGEPCLRALWLGLFTAVSAFCNAGFFPGTSSLINYNSSGLILHTVALLMIAGGIAPVLAVIIDRCRQRKALPFSIKVILAATSCLLIGGMIFLLIWEWNGILDGLSPLEKITNAWFLSASLRTGGFNSVPMASAANGFYIIMLILMFIGGSPGGTAGGVKTTSVAVLFLTFRSALYGRREVTCGMHRITINNIMQAVAIIFAWALLCVVTIMLLTATQDISFRELVFEGVSALGTVGLSIGATAKLDEIGKVIIMIAMFIGRIGPLTFFLLLSESGRRRSPGLPEMDLPLG